MKRYRMNELVGNPNDHALESIIPGKYIKSGGLGFAGRGERSHTNDGPNGTDYHVHNDCEAFLILQGKGIMELNGEKIPVSAGDIFVVEPGEDHHLISDENDPIVTLWCHAGEERHAKQKEQA